MTKLKELEQRLRDEPENLGLRVVVAGALHEAGRRADAVELYRSVAIAYRDQGRQQQAIAVCRSILELAPEDAPCGALLAALLAAPAPRASPPPGSRPSPMPSRPSPMPSRPSPVPWRPSPVSSPAPWRPSPSPLLRPSEPVLRPSEPEPLPRPSEPGLRPSEPPLRPSELTAAEPLLPLPDPTAAGPLRRPSELTVADPPLRPSELTTGGPVRRSSGEMTPLPAPLAYHDADPTIGTLRLSPADLPPSLREELAAYPEIAGIAAAARQISASLIAASRMIEQTEELDDDDLSAEVDTGRLLRTGAPKLPPSASVPPPIRRPPTPPPILPPVRRPPTPSPASRAAAPGPPAPATLGSRAPSPVAPLVTSAGLAASAGDDDEPTLPPPAAPGPGPIEDEKTEPRELPTRVRPPSIAPPTVATGPLASAFFAPLPPRNRAAVLQRFRRRMVAPGTAVIHRGETAHGLIIVVRGRLELHAEDAAGAPVAVAAFEPGDYLGEASLLARAPAPGQVVAAADSELLVLSADDFYDVTSAFPALRLELEATAARRAREPGLPR